ncbi:MAG: ATPase [Anaerolineae bacterium]|nr:ATPase [Anaerolineae bacterium]
MTGYYFGIDAGNSKTHALIADGDGHVLALAGLGSGNWEGIGLDNTRAVYHEVLARALAEAGLDRAQISAAGYGLAGYDFPSDDTRLRPIVESLELPGPYFLENDALIALRAGTTRPYGVVCIAGAGSTKAGRAPDGRVFRTWGLGGYMGDEGGGGWLCRKAFGAAAQAAKGIGPQTRLTGRLLAHYGAADVTALIEQVARGGDYRIDYAHLVFEAAQAADPVAAQILLEGAHSLAAGCQAVIRALAMDDTAFELVLAGGIFQAEYALLRDALAHEVRRVAPGVEVVRLTAPPVVGAILLAMDEHGQSTSAALRARLVAEAQARLGE